MPEKYVHLHSMSRFMNCIKITQRKLTQKAKTLKLTNYSKLNKSELVLAIMEAQMEKDGNYYMEGVLDDIQPDGYGFLRTVNYSKGEKDIYISASQIRRFEIKRGDKVTGKVRKPKDNEKYYGLLQVDFVNDENAEVVKTPSLSSFNSSILRKESF